MLLITHFSHFEFIFPYFFQYFPSTLVSFNFNWIWSNFYFNLPNCFWINSLMHLLSINSSVCFSISSAWTWILFLALLSSSSRLYFLSLNLSLNNSSFTFSIFWNPTSTSTDLHFYFKIKLSLFKWISQGFPSSGTRVPK